MPDVGFDDFNERFRTPLSSTPFWTVAAAQFATSLVAAAPDVASASQAEVWDEPFAVAYALVKVVSLEVAATEVAPVIKACIVSLITATVTDPPAVPSALVVAFVVPSKTSTFPPASETVAASPAASS